MKGLVAALFSNADRQSAQRQAFTNRREVLVATPTQQQTKNSTMKTNQIHTATRFTGLVAALLLIGGAITTARAHGAKGGATLLMPPTAPVSTSEYKATPCSKCKSEWTTRAEVTTKGTTPVVAAVEKLLCNGCATKIETVGFGKAKYELATHKCTPCCSASASGVATTATEKTFVVGPVK